jgi:uncharacterized surface protein with fasciclin (FAS1) repeats
MNKFTLGATVAFGALLALPFAAQAMEHEAMQKATGAAHKAMEHMGMVKTGDVVDVAIANGSFKTLADLLGKAGLVETLKGKGPFTVFAPTDAAFAKLPAETVADLVKPENKAKLAKILTYHVVSGKVESKDLAGKKLEPATVEGSKVMVDATGSSVMVDGATVTAADVAASNGVIHVIDTVLMPK